MRKNKGVRFKGVVISCIVIFCILAIVILVVPAFISENYIRQKVVQVLEDRFKSALQVGPVSFHWPNRLSISYLSIQRQGQNGDAPIEFRDIQGTLKLLPLLWKECIIKKISIRQINYENRLLVNDFVTDKFSYKNEIISGSVRLNINDGPAAIKGSVDFHQKKPVFDMVINARDVHITQDVPALNLLPIFAVKEGEIGGILSLEGSIQGKGLGKDILNKKLAVTMNLQVREGYIRGNKLFSSLLEIVGLKDGFSFQSMDALVQIKDGKVYTPKMDIQAQVMDLSASGMAEFEGEISYDTVVKFKQEYLSKDVEKIAGILLEQNELPVEIRGTTKNPKVAVKLSSKNLEHIVKGLVKDYLDTSEDKHEKEKKNN